jgi:dienelactone hydrolase
VPPEQARALQAALERRGVPSRLELYPSSGHGFLIYQERERDRHGEASAEYREAREAWAGVLEFLRASLR